MRGIRLVTALALTSCLTTSSAEAKPRWPRVSWTGPTHTTLTVAWTDDAVGAGSAEVRPVGGTATTVTASAASTGTGDLDATFVARVTGLIPASSYEYRVQSAGSWSTWYPVRTAPAPGSCAAFRFVAGGDSRGEELPLVGYQPSRQFPDIMSSIAAQGPLFVLHTGDFVRTGDKADQWAEEMPNLERVSKSIPFFMIMGNHDDGPGVGAGARFNSVFEYPADGPDKVDDYYSFVVGNVLFVGMSTYTWSFDAQIDWLKTLLVAHKADVDWRVLFFHTPVWSSGAHGNNEGDKARAAKLVPILDEFGVDVVFHGHDHDYERFHPSKGGWGGVPRVITPLPLDGGRRGVATGTTYIVTGGAGALVNPTFSASSTGSAKGSNRLHYVIADANKDQLKLTVRDCGSQGLGGASCSGEIEVVTLLKASTVCDTGGPDAGGGDAGADSATDAATTDSAADTTTEPDAFADDGGSVEDAAPADAADASPVPDQDVTDSGGCGCDIPGRSTPLGRTLELAGLSALLLVLRRNRAGRARGRHHAHRRSA